MVCCLLYTPGRIRSSLNNDKLRIHLLYNSLMPLGSFLYFIHIIRIG